MKTTFPVRIDSLIESLPSEYTQFDRELIARAFRLADQAHSGQKRASGEPYINHCLAVASILAELRVPPEVVAAGLLHDIVEDTSISLNDLKRDFGETVASLVDGVTKLANLPRVSRGDQHVETTESKSKNVNQHESLIADPSIRSRKRDLASETLRKTFLAMGDDIRVVLIKLADRLHNMRTLGYMPEHKRKRIAQETLEIFAPLANRLGIWNIKWELEDLAFRYVDPDKYKDIAEQLSDRRDKREAQIREIVDKLQSVLKQNNLSVEISGRPKHIYSIYRKMIEKDKTFEMVRDVRGVRLIVPDIPSCYATLGVIHTRWRPIPSEFDDYIAAPKDNFYQSLHTAVIYDDGKPLEVQIRTAEMHQNAEYGIASHWRYKEGGPRDEVYEQRIMWLRRIMEWRQDVEDAQEFVDSMKTDVFQDRVYVFTPRGDIIDLPSGSTPIDFAYHVHTDIGHRCRGAKVNGKLVPLDHVLLTGEQVEILTSKHGGPSRDWLNPNLGMVATQRARSKIRLWFKKQDREQNLTQGRMILERELHRLGIIDLNMEDLARDLDQRTPDDLYVALGCGDISVGKIVKRLSEAEQPPEDIIPVSPAKASSVATNAVTVVGLKGILTNLAKCCNPTPGDQIIGYITRGRGATIHRQDCSNILRSKERERLVRVSWGENIRTYPVPVRITAYDRQGLMVDISNLLANEGVNIINADIRVNRNLADMKLIVEVTNISQLSRLLTRIENLPNVMEAQRINGG